MAQPLLPPLEFTPLDIGDLNLRESEQTLLTSRSRSSSSSSHRPPSGTGIPSGFGTISSTIGSDEADSSRNSCRPSTDRNEGEDNSIVQILPTFEGFDNQQENHARRFQTHDRWRPAFLRRRIVYGFLIALAVLIGALETIFAISKKRQGLATSSASLHYIWTYGPTAISTCFSAIWACVAYEAKAVAPWLRVEKPEGVISERLFLDYIYMFPLFVPIRAARNRDFLVTACTAISYLFTILTVISPSLIILTRTNVDKPATAQTRFVDDASRLSNVGLMPLYNALGLVEYGLPWPDGVSETFAYQSVMPSSTEATGLRAVVDGLSFAMQCQIATLGGIALNAAANFSTALHPGVTTSLNISSPGCNLALTTEFSDSSFLLQKNSSTKTIGRLLDGQCEEESSAGYEGRRLAFLLGTMNYTTVNNSNAYSYSLDDSTFQQLICSPSYTVSDVEVVQQAVGTPQVSLAEDPRNRTLEHVHAWDLTDAIMKIYKESNFDAKSAYNYVTLNSITTDLKYGNISSPMFSMDLDDYTTVILGLNNNSFVDKSSFFNATLLESALQNYSRMHATLLVHDTLMDFAAVDNVGSFQVQEQRLIVQVLACQLMVGLCAVSMVILLTILSALPKDMSFSGNPGTILGTLMLAKPALLGFPKGFGAASLPRLREILPSGPRSIQSARRSSTETNSVYAHTKFHQPPNLHPASRISIVLSIAGILAVLEILLRQSARSDGIGLIRDQTYLHYLWTTLPAVVLALLGLYFNSVDSELRALSPFGALRRGRATANVFLGPQLLGRLFPQAIHAELRIRNFAAALATTASFLASSLTIVVGSLFVENSLPAVVPTQLRLIDTFSSDIHSDSYNYEQGTKGGSYRGLISSLILESNLSYPPNTYEDLAFPALVWEGQTASLESANATFMNTTGVVPAMRSRLNCHKYPQSSVSATYLRDFDPQAVLTARYGDNATGLGDLVGAAGDWILVNITGEVCGSSDGFLPELSATANFYVGEEAPAFGAFGATSISNNISFSACSGFVYVWGSFNTSDDTGEVITVSAATCNFSVETVETDATFSGLDLQIDTTRAPSPREDTVQIVIPEYNASQIAGLDSYYLYSGLVSRQVGTETMSHPTFFDTFFSLLTTSRYAIPIGYLTNPQEGDEVISAIVHQHGIISAQAISAMARLSLPSNTNMTSYPHHIDPGVFVSSNNNATSNDSSMVIETTSTNSYGAPKRIQMDATATRVLEALLGAILGLSLLGWALMPRTAILPRPATSIAGILALFVDGNILHVWKDDMGSLRVAIRDHQVFWLGWGPPGQDENAHEQRRFGIWAVPKDTS